MDAPSPVSPVSSFSSLSAFASRPMVPVGAPRSKRSAPPTRTLQWLADDEQVWLRVAPSQLTAALGVPTGNGLFARETLPPYAIVAEYHGVLMTPSMVKDDTYAFSLGSGALFESGVRLELRDGVVNALLADPRHCLAANANTIFPRDRAKLQAAYPPLNVSLNAVLVTATDPRMAKALTLMGQNLFRTSPLALRMGDADLPVAHYTHPRVFVVTFDEIKAGEEIFLNYGSEYAAAADPQAASSAAEAPFRRARTSDEPGFEFQ